MKKIMHLLSTNAFSGAENVVCTIIENMKEQYEMSYCSPNGTIKDYLEHENINYLPLKKFSYFEVKRLLKEYEPDIIHAHDYKASCLASLFNRKYKIISHIHGNNRALNRKNIKSLIFRIVSNKISKIIWVSDSAYNDFYYKQKIQEKSIILYNVIDYKKVEKKSTLKNNIMNHDVVFIGRLEYPKNPERLIEIVKLLKDKKENISVGIVGDGTKKNKLESMIKKYNLKDCIKMYGYQKNPFPILKKSKFLIITSEWEGTPMIALEAQSLGKPIISTPIDGMKKIVINDKNGYLSEDNTELVDKIIEFLNKKTYMELSKNSIEKFHSFNNLDQYKKILDNIYNE